MPPPALCPCRAVPRPSAVVNADIRRLAERTAWSPEALAELAELRAEWRAAVAAEERAA